MRKLMRVLFAVIPRDERIEARAFWKLYWLLERVVFLPGEVPIGYLEQPLLFAVGQRRRHLHALAEIMCVRIHTNRFHIHRQHQATALDVFLLASGNVDTGQDAEEGR